MDAKTLAAVTNALDIAIASVVETEFQRLATAAGPEQTAGNVLRSLRSFERLQRGVMPAYNEWDAVFYAAWYHPGHVNLAYTLIEKIPASINPLKSGKGSLHIRDFGCGTLAMQFGLALAAADSLEEIRIAPRINILSEDSSEPMRAIGWRIWEAFVDEISDGMEYPELDALRRVCSRISFENQSDDVSVVWLSALHVAYKENSGLVWRALSARVQEHSPDAVVVTAHRRNSLFAYNPRRHGYVDESQTFHGAVFSLEGIFELTSAFRQSVYDGSVGPINLPSDDDDRFIRNYLTRHQTGWVTPFLETRDFLYTRNQVDDLDDLPF